MKKTRVTGIVLGTLLTATSAIATDQAGEIKQYADMSLDDLLNVTITTASRSAESAKDVPVTTYVITRDEILNRNYRSLTDALNSAPGFMRAKITSGLLGEQFLMRGVAGSYYTKILLDGLPIMASARGVQPIGEEIDMKNIDRIEIVYGPASALYGADAVSGVINLITYKPDKTTVRGEALYGSKGYTYANANANASLLDNKLKFGVHASYAKRDDTAVKDGYENIYDRNNSFNLAPMADFGLIMQAAQITMPDYSLSKLKANYYSYGAYLKFADFTLSYDHLYRADPSPTTMNTNLSYYDDPSTQIKEKKDKLSLQHELHLTDLTFNTNVNYLRYRMLPDSKFKSLTSYKNDYIGYEFAGSDDLLAEEIVNWKISNNFKLTTGASYQKSGDLPQTNFTSTPFDASKYKAFATSVDWSDPVMGKFGINPYKWTNTGVFAQLSFNYDKLNTLAGIRYDHQSLFGNSTNPRVAAQYNFTKDTSARASYGTSFKAPTPDSMYVSYAFPLTLKNQTVRTDLPAPYPATVVMDVDSKFYLYVPFTDQKPEKLKSAELALRHQLTNKMTLEGIYSFNELTQKVAIVDVPIDPVAYPNSLNVQSAAQTGVQIPVSSIQNSSISKSTIHSLDLIFRTQDIIESVRLNSDLFFTFSKGKMILPNGDKTKYAVLNPGFLGKWNLSARPIQPLYISLVNSFNGKFMPFFNNDSAYTDDMKTAGSFRTDLAANYELLKDFKVEGEVLNLFDKKYGSIHGMATNTLIISPQPRRTFYAGVNYTF